MKSVINLSDRKTMWLLLVVVVAVGAYAWSVKEINDDILQERIEKLTEDSVKAKQQRDSANIRLHIMYNKVVNLEGKLHETYERNNLLQTAFDGSLKKKEKLTDEKDYIPDNVATDDIATYLSDYEYKPYE